MNYEQLREMALDSGFSYTAPLNTDTIELKQEVRDMCAQGCQQYAKRWSCPPGCGSLEELHASQFSFLPLGTGCCMICETCTYPDTPCRFPQKKISSMEAYGMLVSEICQKNQLKYYYGPNTISYVACVLF